MSERGRDTHPLTHIDLDTHLSQKGLMQPSNNHSNIRENRHPSHRSRYNSIKRAGYPHTDTHIELDTYLSQKGLRRGCSSTDAPDPFFQQMCLLVYAHLTVLEPVLHPAFENSNLPTAELPLCLVFGLQELYPLDEKHDISLVT